jgi:hypothetical protein
MSIDGQMGGSTLHDTNTYKGRPTLYDTNTYKHDMVGHDTIIVSCRVATPCQLIGPDTIRSRFNRVVTCRAYTPGTHTRKDEDGLLLEFPCNSTRTRSV